MWHRISLVYISCAIDGVNARKLKVSKNSSLLMGTMAIIIVNKGSLNGKKRKKRKPNFKTTED